jgi:hypothetical protein
MHFEGLCVQPESEFQGMAQSKCNSGIKSKGEKSKRKRMQEKSSSLQSHSIVENVEKIGKYKAMDALVNQRNPKSNVSSQTDFWIH